MVSAVRPRRRLDAVRRPQIVAATIELIREKGLWTVRTSDVAKRAGLSPTSVVYYFGTKDQLFAEAIAGADDAFYDTALDELARLERAADRMAWLVVRSSTTDWLLWMDLWVYTRHHPDTTLAQRRFQRRWRQTIQDIIEYGNGTGEWQGARPFGRPQRPARLTPRRGAASLGPDRRAGGAHGPRQPGVRRRALRRAHADVGVARARLRS